MRIKRLTLNNIGPFAGKQSFLFQTDNPQKQIVLIGGRNGAGKTTLFESIRLCLYGYKLYGYRQNSQIQRNIPADERGLKTCTLHLFVKGFLVP